MLIIVAYVGPYFLIPATFKMAGGAFANLAGMVNNRGKGAFDRLRNARGKQYKRKWSDARGGKYFKGGKEGGLRSTFNKGLENVVNQDKGGMSVNPYVRAARVRSALGENAFEHSMEMAEKLPGAKAFFASDDLILAGLHGKGDRKTTMEWMRNNTDYNEAQIRMMTEQALRMRQSMGHEAFTVAALAKAPATGTAFVGDDIGEWHELIAKNTHGNGSLAASIVAAGKGGFRSAQRYEVSEAGFGDHMKAIAMADAGASRQAITDMIVDKAYEGGGPGAVIGARNDKSALQFAKAMNRSMDNAQDMRVRAEAMFERNYNLTGDQAKVQLTQRAQTELANAQRSGDQQAIARAQVQVTAVQNMTGDAAKAQLVGEAKQMLAASDGEILRSTAAASSVHEQVGQAKQLVSRVLGDEVFSKKVDIIVPDIGADGRQKVDARTGDKLLKHETGNRVQQFDTLRDNSIWQQTKREYVSSIGEFLQQAPMEAQALANQQNQNAPGRFNPPGPGGFNPPGPPGG